MSIYTSCRICNISSESIRKLSKHIRDHHKNISIKLYYDTYIKRVGEGICVICKKNTRYSSLGEGYRLTCSPNCACKMHRQNLLNDPIKYAAFRNKVKENQTEIWESALKMKLIVYHIKAPKSVIC